MPIFISSPAVNLHSPTAIGDVAPNTVAATAVQVTHQNNFDEPLLKLDVASAGFGMGISREVVAGSYVFTKDNAGGGFSFQNGASGAPIKALRPTFTGIPTSASGLSSGDVYSNAGILTIVP